MASMTSQPQNHLWMYSAWDGRQSGRMKKELLTPTVCLMGSPTMSQISTDIWILKATKMFVALSA